MSIRTRGLSNAPWAAYVFPALGLLALLIFFYYYRMRLRQQNMEEAQERQRQQQMNQYADPMVASQYAQQGGQQQQPQYAVAGTAVVTPYAYGDGTAAYGNMSGATQQQQHQQPTYYPSPQGAQPTNGGGAHPYDAYAGNRGYTNAPSIY